MVYTHPMHGSNKKTTVTEKQYFSFLHAHAADCDIRSFFHFFNTSTQLALKCSIKASHYPQQLFMADINLSA